jgi:hypothetical protein
MSEPRETTNIDRYGDPEMPWSRAVAALSGPPAKENTYFLGTCRPDGTPHSAGIGAQWLDGHLYFTSNLTARKARDLAVNPRCTISARLPAIDLVFDGTAELVSDAGTLERIAQGYRDGGWPAQAEDGALTAPYSAPSAGPPPWHVYRFTFHQVVGVATEEPYGATRWRF